MQIDEFDKFADEYLQVHASNLRVSGEDPEYFTRYKIEALRRRWDYAGRPEPTAILDFGCGIGSSLSHLSRLFPGATVTGLDVSERSLVIAAQRFAGGRLVHHDGGPRLPLSSASFDLAFSACVFHHIPAPEHVGLLAELRRVLKPGGVIVVFEHNPANPVTRYIVATCPFDVNAELIAPKLLKRRMSEAGFRAPEATYTGFFPRVLSILRPAEPWLSRIPLGAQYYVAADA